MICEKCGTEFEGRDCPNCGTLAIFVKEDEYQERRQEWEEENAPKDENAKKFKLNIKIDPVVVKKCAIGAAVICVVLTVLFAAVKLITNFFKQEQYVLVYDNGTVMNADSRSFDVYPVEDAVFSADGNYAYANHFFVDEIQGEIIRSYVSPSGEYGAIVSMEGTETAKYYLYLVENNEALGAELIRQGNNEIRIVEVTNDGKIYYEEAELGAYSVVLNSSLYEYEDGKNKQVAEDVVKFVSCENENEFIYYDSDLQAYWYSDGKVTALNEGSYGYEYALTSEGEVFYLSPNGELYKEGVLGSIDRGITGGTLKAVANSDKVIYVKDGGLYCYGENIKTPIQLITEYDAYEGNCTIVERHGKLYYAYDGTMYVTNKKGKVTSTKEGVKAVYLQKK